MSRDFRLVPTSRLMQAAWGMHETLGIGGVLRAEGQDVHDELGQLLSDAWKGKIDDALEAALEFVLANPDAIMTDALLEKALADMGNVFGDGFAGEVTHGVIEKLGNAYGIGRENVLRPLGIKAITSVVDDEAQETLANDTLYWIGSYWDRDLGGQISEIINSTVIQKGLSRLDAGAVLQATLGGDFPDKSRDYWNLVAVAGAQRASVFGGIASFKQTRVKTVRFVNPNDLRTSEICEHLVGRVFDAKYVYKTFDDFLAAESPEEAKEVHPWRPAAEILAIDDNDALAQLGIVPPLHGHCRSDLVPVEFGGEEDEDAAGNQRAFALAPPYRRPEGSEAA